MDAMETPTGHVEQLSKRLACSPFNEYLGAKILSADERGLTMVMTCDGRHLTTPGHVHGGVVSTLIDTAGFWALAYLEIPVSGTVDLHVDYLRPAAHGSVLLARADVAKPGKRVSFVTVVVEDEKSGKAVASGRAAYFS